MLTTFTANYTKIDSGYMGQLIEWQEVITEGETLELCRESLQDALQEMIAAYKQQNKEIPSSKSLVMSVKRSDLVKYFEENGFYLLREGGNHSIYTNNTKTIPIKRHRTIDRITANAICKQAGIAPKF